MLWKFRAFWLWYQIGKDRYAEYEDLKKNLLNILINSESEKDNNTSEKEESELELEQIESDNSTQYSKESELYLLLL